MQWLPKSKCFFCFDYISIITHSKNLCDVDHFFPSLFKRKEFFRLCRWYMELSVSMRNCNKGENGKFAKLPKIELLKPTTGGMNIFAQVIIH